LRQIGTIADENQARLFSDYLLTLGITTRVDKAADGSVIWVHREEKVDQAKAELQAFRGDPTGAKYRVGSSAKAVRREMERKEREHRRNTIDVRSQWTYRPLRRCRVTYLLLGTSVLLTLATSFGQGIPGIRDKLYFASYHIVQGGERDSNLKGLYLHDMGSVQIASNPVRDLRRGEIWRLVTPIFLHMNWIHLLLNMFWLYDLGGAIELRRGTARYAALVLVSAVISNAGQYYYQHNPLFGGMSGVVYAFFGYVWMKSQYEPELGLRLRRDTVVLMLIWLFYCLSPAMTFARVANGAHFVGLFVGILVGIAPHLLQTGRR
jgi:GlpG protein